ncbi:tetratricopeptide repeat protein [Deefgea piscis]|uniref:tetratricopeptide repeat protein n=1 Tax=Deefgea piscis TaxID=2739061 RepID=UPI001C7EAFCF|nr:tetratricopeptide repeat protein [Deefgea piscis]QZA80701.1 tetratricopeptide repeat protein [Deefgea piscis]
MMCATATSDLALLRHTLYRDHDTAEIDHTIRHAKKTHQLSLLAQALLCRGEYLIDIGEQPSAASKDFREAGILARQLNDWSLLAQTLHWQAQCQLHLGEYMRALDIWLQALQTAIDAEDHPAFVRSYSGIAQVCLVFGQAELALEYQQRAFDLAANIADATLFTDCLLALIANCYQLKHYTEVERLLAQLSEHLAKNPRIEAQAEFHIYTGLVLFDHQQLSAAFDQLQTAKTLAQNYGGLWCRSLVALILGRIYLHQNQHAAARQSLEFCLELGEQIRGFNMSQQAHELLETLCIEQGDYQSALSHLKAGHAKQLQQLQSKAERKLQRISQKQLNPLELELRLALSRIRYRATSVASPSPHYNG